MEEIVLGWQIVTISEKTANGICLSTGTYTNAPCLKLANVGEIWAIKNVRRGAWLIIDAVLLER